MSTCPLNRTTVRNGIHNSIKNSLNSSKVFAEVEEGFIPDINSDYQTVINNINNSFKEVMVMKSGFGDPIYMISEPSNRLIDSYLTPENIVKYELKSVDTLSTSKAKQIFEKGEKNDWPLDKILTELQIPKNQKNLILKSGIKDREGIITNLLANYSYRVEINTTLDTVNEFEYNPYDQKNDDISRPTQHYSNLTVPGGTNYTENEIATPAITPSIKGHAQFATDNGIGWFRSDEEQEYKGELFLLDKYFYQTDGKKYTIEHEDSDGGASKSITKEEYEEARKNKNTKFINERLIKNTRRILELQSDLFQKGRDRKQLTRFNLKKGDRFKTNKGVIEIIDITYGHVWFKNLNLNKSTRLNITKAEELLQEKGVIDLNKSNQFLQLLNKDNNWVTFFVKSIIQDSAKKGYEKVLFPTGNTASKVEGHTTLEEFKKQKEDRIKELEKALNYQITNIEQVPHRNFTFLDNKGETVRLRKPKDKWTITYLTGKENVIEQDTSEDVVIRGFNKYLRDEDNNVKNEINQLKQELERVETEGFGALKPIYNFYENTVTNILKKQGFNPTTITDEYGNTWNEINITPKAESSNIELKSHVDEDGTDAFMILKDGRLVGNLKYYDDGQYINVNDVRIEEEKQGIGTEAYMQLAKIAEQRGKTLRSDIEDSKMNDASRGLWNKFVRLGLAIFDGARYIFTGQKEDTRTEISPQQNAVITDLQRRGLLSQDVNEFGGKTYFKIPEVNGKSSQDNRERLQAIIADKKIAFLHIKSGDLVEVGKVDNILLSAGDSTVKSKSSKAGKVTKAKVLKFLDNIGFTNVQKVNTLVHNGKKIEGEAYIDFINNVMQIVEGAEDYTLTEESMHILVELIKNSRPELYERMSKEVINYKLYADTVADYKDNSLYQDENGNPDYQKIKDEAVAKLLAEYLTNQLESTEASKAKLETVYTWWQSILNWIKETFTKYKNPFKQALEELEVDNQAFGQYADLSTNSLFLSAKTNDQIDKENPLNREIFDRIINRPAQDNVTKIGENYYKDGKRINYSQEELEQITDVNELMRIADELAISVKSQEAQSIINEIIENQPERVSDLTRRHYKELFGSRNFDPANEAYYNQSRDDGTDIHSTIEAIINAYIDPKTGLMLKNKTNIVYPPSHLTEQMRNKLEAYIKNLIANYDTGTRFITEQVVYDTNATFKGKVKGRYGTIDFLAISPQGVVDIIDWKSILELDEQGVKDYKKQGIFLQLNEYKRILSEQYDIKKFGKLRAIPIGKNYKVTEVNKVKTFTLSNINIGSPNAARITDEERYLRPVISPEESTGSVLKDTVIQKLSKLYERYIAEGRYNDDRDTLNHIDDAIYEIRVTDEVSKLAIFFTELGIKLDALLSEKDTLIKNNNKQDISEALAMMKLYDDILDNIVEPATKLEDDPVISEEERKNLKAKREVLSKHKEQLIEFRNALLESMAKSAGVLDLLLPEKVVNLGRELFRSLGSQNMATARYMYVLVKKAYNKIDFDTDKALKKLKELKFNFDKWAKEKGLSNKDAIGKIVNFKKGTLHSKIDKAFYEKRSETLTSKNRDNIRDFIKTNYNLDNYNTWYKEEFDKLVQKHKETIYNLDPKKDKQIKLNQLKKFEVNYDFNKHPVTAFGSHNKRIWSKNIKEKLWYSPEYKELREKGNEIALETYNYFVSRNEDLAATGAIDDYQAYTFFPNMRKSLGDILSIEDNNILSKSIDSITQQFVDFRRSISIDDYELNFEGARDPISGEKLNKRFVPFVNAMKADEKSFDIFSVYGLMSKQIAKETYLQENDEIIRALVKLEQTKPTLFKDKYGNILKDATGKARVNDTSDGIGKNAKIVEQHMKAIVNGETIQFDSDMSISFDLRNKWNNSPLGKLYKFDTTSKDYKPTAISATKFVMWLNTVNQKRILGINAASAISNLFGGSFSSRKIFQQYLTKEDLDKSWLKMTSGNFYSTESAKKNAALVDYFLPLLNNRESHKAGQLSVSDASKFLSQDWLMAPMRKTSEIVQLNVFFALIENTGLIDGKIVNLYQEAMKLTDYQNRYSNPVTGEVSSEEFIKSKEKEFKAKLTELKEKYGLNKLAQYKTIQENGKDKVIIEIPGIDRNSLDVEKLRDITQTMAKDALGEADEFDIANYKYSIYWRLFMTFKNWIPRQADVRFGEFRYDQAHEAYEYGRIRMFAKSLAGNYAQSVIKLIPLPYLTKVFTNAAFSKEPLIKRAKEVYLQKMEEEKSLGSYNKDTFISEGEFIDKFIQGTESTFAEIRTMGLMLLFLFVGIAAPDDDDSKEEKWWKTMTRRQVNKLIDEVGFFYSPKSGVDLLGGSAPVLGMVRDTWNFSSEVLEQTFGFGLENVGFDEKGMEMQEHAKPVKRLFKLAPVLKEFLTYLPAISEDLAKEWGVKLSDQRAF